MIIISDLIKIVFQVTMKFGSSLSWSKTNVNVFLWYFMSQTWRSGLGAIRPHSCSCRSETPSTAAQGSRPQPSSPHTRERPRRTTENSGPRENGSETPHLKTQKHQHHKTTEAPTALGIITGQYSTSGQFIIFTFIWHLSQKIRNKIGIILIYNIN